MLIGSERTARRSIWPYHRLSLCLLVLCLFARVAHTNPPLCEQYQVDILLNTGGLVNGWILTTTDAFRPRHKPGTLTGDDIMSSPGSTRLNVYGGVWRLLYPAVVRGMVALPKDNKTSVALKDIAELRLTQATPCGESGSYEASEAGATINDLSSSAIRTLMKPVPMLMEVPAKGRAADSYSSYVLVTSDNRFTVEQLGGFANQLILERDNIDCDASLVDLLWGEGIVLVCVPVSHTKTTDR
jgi:hypothetical protein